MVVLTPSLINVVSLSLVYFSLNYQMATASLSYKLGVFLYGSYHPYSVCTHSELHIVHTKIVVKNFDS